MKGRPPCSKSAERGRPCPPRGEHQGEKARNEAEEPSAKNDDLATGHSGRSSGMALLITLLVMLILAVLVNRFAFATRVHLAAAANLRDQFQAECLALSGVELAMALLEEDDTPEVDHVGEPWALLREVSGEVLGLAEGAFAVMVQDESAKIDINRLVKEDGSTTDEFIHRQLDRLLDIFGIPSDQRDALLDCLEDWLDDDDLQKLNGAEAAYYQGLENPYLPRNGPLRSLGELILVKGWREVIDARLNEGPALLDLLTTGPTEGTINVNTASPLVLMTLSAEIDESAAEQVVTLREEAPLTGPQLLPPAFRKKAVQSHIRYNSNLFLVRAEGLFRRSVSRAVVLVKREEEEVTVLRRIIE